MSAVLEKPALTQERVLGAIADAQGMLCAAPAVLNFELIGSAAYLPTPKDVDFIVQVAPPPEGQAFDAVAEFCDPLVGNGWEYCGEYSETLNGWNAIRKGDLNLIVTSDPRQFQAYKNAMEVCKALNLSEKRERRLVCRIVRDNMTEDEARGLAASKGEVDE